MASAHIIRFSISSPFSFHEEVCRKEEIQLRHINLFEVELRTEANEKKKQGIIWIHL